MRPQLISASALSRAARLLNKGEIVAFPTDTFFALGAVLEIRALDALFAVKGRMAGNPVPVLVSSIDQALQVAEELPDAARLLADAFWPGALTIVLPVRDCVPGTISAGAGTVGVRMPDHEIALRLIRETDRPLTGTSANRSGMPPCKTAEEVMAQLAEIPAGMTGDSGAALAAVVDSACGEHTAPSTVVGFDSAGLKIFREGSISRSSLEAALESAGA